jgi:zinc metalloprotease ZmpA
LKRNPRVATAAGALAIGLVTAGAVAAVSSPSLAAPSSPEAIKALAVKAADNYVASRPGALHASADEAFQQQSVTSSAGLQYVNYQRTYKGLHVAGGDLVVVLDAAGNTKYTSVAQDRSIGSLSVVPRLTKTDAETVAKAQSQNVSAVESTNLVVYSLGATPALAWESTVDGTNAEGPSRLTVEVDALTGKVLATQEHVMHGTGTGAWNGPNPLSFTTTHSGSTYTMQSTLVRNMPCQDYSAHTTFSGPDDVWGNGNATSKETACVDALFVAETEFKMLSAWLGRNGMDGNGGAWPIRIGDPEENAFYDGSQVAIGYNSKSQWIPSLDVLGHEMGHGIDDHTGTGISGGGTQEFVADTFGAATEWYANEPSGYDTPDFTVGETVNLVGQGPIRYMYNPSLAGDSNCYSSSTPSQEVHAAAGPGNHWFYLMAEGTNPTNGQPTSPTCNSSSVSGIGIQKAIQIMYNAMLMKTSGATYPKYRLWTLQAAKNLFPGSCTEFNAVKAAWNAVSMPAQSGEATCTGGGGSPSASPSTSPTGGGGGTCSGNKLANPGFESGTASWSGDTGTIGQWSSQGEPAHSGTYSAYLDGYGSTHTEAVSQSVSIPSGCHATLSLYLHIDSAETTTSTAYDKLTISAGSTTVATFSNLNKGTGFTQRSYDISALAGQTVTIKFSGTEDSSLQTSFVIDDTAVTLS